MYNIHVFVCAYEVFAERPTEWRLRRIFSATEETCSSFFLPSPFVDAATRVGFVFQGGAPQRNNKLLADGPAFLDFFVQSYRDR